MPKTIMTVDNLASTLKMVSFTIINAEYGMIEPSDGQDALIGIKSI